MTNQSDNEITLAQRIAQEDHLLKANGDVPLLIAMDRLSCPKGDPKKAGRLKKGAEMFVHWYGDKAKAGNREIVEGTSLLRKNFSGYINEWKKNNTNNSGNKE